MAEIDREICRDRERDIAYVSFLTCTPCTPNLVDDATFCDGLCEKHLTDCWPKYIKISWVFVVSGGSQQFCCLKLCSVELIFMRFHTDIQQAWAGIEAQTHKAWWVYFPWTYGGKYKEIHKSNNTQKTWHAVLPDLCDADAQNYSCTSTKDRSNGWQHFPPVCLRQFLRKKILTGVRVSNLMTTAVFHVA